MFKITLKFLVWVFVTIFGFIALAYLVFWVVNLHDQLPSEIAQYFESNYSNRIKVPDQDNAFVYVMGFSVAQNEDPKVWGEKRIALVIQATDKEIGDLSSDPIMKDYLYKDVRHPFVKQLSDMLQVPIDEKCFLTLEKNDGVIAEWVNSEAWLLNRYLELLSYQQYQEYVMTDASMPLPNYAAVMDAQKLFFSSLWLQAEQGNSENVKNLLEQDAVYWRMALASSDMLISKMIATVALKRHFVVGNLILKKLSSQKNISAIPENWKIPFARTELSMLRTFSGEWIFQDRVFKKLKRKPDDYFYNSFYDGEARWFANLVLPFLQPQEISNQQAVYFKKLVNSLDVSLDKYIDAIDDAEDEYVEEKEQQAKKLINHIYNVTGNYLISRSEAEYGLNLYIPYSSRVTDLEGARQAAVLTDEIRNQSLSSDAIAAFVANSTYQNPYTQKPFEWDSESKSIKFTGLEEGERGAYNFIY